MKRLLVLRHAKSSWGHVHLSDHERPLNNRGQHDAPRMGQLMKREEIVPSLIITSSAKRARTTAQLAADAAGFEGELWVTRDFYHADPEIYLHVLRQKVADVHQIVMVVGHNPGMEELVEQLTDWSGRFTTANLAHIALPIGSWRELDDLVTGQLLNLWQPRALS